jgi:hypothetical protein
VAAAPATTAGATATTLATTTAAAPTIELVAEFAGRRLEPFHSDGALIYATSAAPDGQSTMVAIDGNGAIVNEVPGSGLFIFGPAVVDGQVFLFASGDVCGFYPFDLAALAVGAPIVVNSGGFCGGGLTIEPTSPSVAWVVDGSTAEVVRVDLASGQVQRFAFGSAVPEHYEAFGSTVLDGVAYIPLSAGFDAATSQQFTAPDGTPLPDLVLQFDPATGTGRTFEGGFVEVIDGAIVVFTDNGPMSVDPATLALAPFPAAFGGPTEGPTIDGTTWSAYTDGGSNLIVTGFDASSTLIHEATIDAGLDPQAFNAIRIFAIGGMPLVLVGEELYDETTQQSTFNATLYRVTGV